jgi:hypothetical protein
MTNTTIYNAVSLGTTSEIRGGSPTKTTLQTGTTGLVLNLKIVSGDNQNQSDAVELYYAVSPFNLTADATLIPKLRPQAGILRVFANQAGSGEAYDTTGVIFNNGGYLYTWFNSPAMAQSGSGTPTITLTSVEQP